MRSNWPYVTRDCTARSGFAGTLRRFCYPQFAKSADRRIRCVSDALEPQTTQIALMAADGLRLHDASPQDTIVVMVRRKRTCGQTRLRSSLVRRGKNRAVMVDASGIRKVAISFRSMFAGLSEQEKLNLPQPFHKFPCGSCHPASIVLGRYLRLMFGIEPQVISAERTFSQPRGWSTHAWLEVDGLVIDITADQFGQKPVVVTRRSPWHRRFRNIKREALDSWGEEWWNTWCAPVFARFTKFVGG